MAPIELDNVSKSYGVERAADGIDLTVHENVTTAIVGPSGGGKSTLLQLMNGLVRPDSGCVRIFGSPIDYDNLPALRRRIGYAVQGTGLFPHMRVGENITLLARLDGWDALRVADRVAELMDKVGLDGALMQRYPHELSGGQQQRVGLCRAMMLNPSVFLLDEPFGALDPITRAEIQREFLELQRFEPRTIVLVTHDVREALRLADRIVIVDQGRLVQEDIAQNVVNRPASPFVRQLIASQLDRWDQHDSLD